MKIATWNLERPLKGSQKNEAVIRELQAMEADIYILTESNEVIKPFEDYHCYSTTELEKPYYKDGERRTMIWTRYPAIKTFSTYNDQTSVCVQLQTLHGVLAVYGTVMGVFGNRRPEYNDEVIQQMGDIKRISQETSVCLAGDLNMTFRDNFYHTAYGRKLLLDGFADSGLKNLTHDIAKNIDHIVVSESFVKGRKIKTAMPINTDYALSDHLGVMVEIR